MVDFSKLGQRTETPASTFLRGIAAEITPETWCRWAIAETVSGNPVEPSDDRACRWCALGRLRLRSANVDPKSAWHAWNALMFAAWEHSKRTRNVGGALSIVEFNDEVAKDADEVSALFVRAAEAIERGAVQ